jgi:RNA-directed DNA polymerase
VEETDKQGKRKMTGGRGSKSGTPQGGVVSPLLANIYMNRFLRVFHDRGKDRAHRARLVSYADDFVILSQGCAESALDWTRGVLGAIGLSLNESKTCIRDARREPFDFLGYSFGPDTSLRTGRRYLSARPSKKSVQRMKQAVRDRLRIGNMAPWQEIALDLNRLLRGWAGYFSYGTRVQAYRAIDRFVYDRVRHFLRRRHKVSSRGTRCFSYEKLYGDLGIVKLKTLTMPGRAVGVA